MEWQLDATDALNVRNVRHAVSAYLSAHAVVDEAELATAEIVVDELVANVHRHAAGPASVRLDWQPEPPTLTVSDEGPGFAPEIDAPEPFQTAGRGLYLVQRLVGEVVVKPRAGRGAEVSVRLPVRRRLEGAPAADEGLAVTRARARQRVPATARSGQIAPAQSIPRPQS